MRNYITKEVVFTSLHFVEVAIVNGKIESHGLPPIEIMGRLSDTRIEREGKRAFPGQNILLFDKTETVKKYRMRVTDFLQNAEEVALDTPEEDDEEDEEV